MRFIDSSGVVARCREEDFLAVFEVEHPDKPDYSLGRLFVFDRLTLSQRAHYYLLQGGAPGDLFRSALIHGEEQLGSTFLLVAAERPPYYESPHVLKGVAVVTPHPWAERNDIPLLLEQAYKIIRKEKL